MSLGISRQSSRSETRPLFTSTDYSGTGAGGGGSNIGGFSGLTQTDFEAGPGSVLLKLLGGSQSGLGRTLHLDPSIRALQEQAIGRSGQGQGLLSQAVGQFGGQISGLRESALGSLPDYIKSQLSPLQQEIAQQQGGLQRTLGQRGLGGSSFGQQALGSFATQAGRALADTRAQAVAQGTSMLANLSQMELAAKQLESQGLTKEAELLRQISNDRANVELKALLTTGSESQAFGHQFSGGLGSGGGGGGGGTD